MVQTAILNKSYCQENQQGLAITDLVAWQRCGADSRLDPKQLRFFGPPDTHAEGILIFKENKAEKL